MLRLAPELGKENLHAMADDAAIDLGYRYRSDAVVADGGADDGLFVDPHEPAAVPGVRAPHVALEDGSTLDLLRPFLRGAHERRGLAALRRKGSASRRT